MRTVYPTSKKRRARGQALIETVIVMPFMVFLVLGALQLMLMQHGRVMTEYAAYNAARAGIVHNADWNVMRNAGLISVLPVYQRTDTLPHFLVAWGKMKVLAEVTELVDTLGATVEQVTSDLLNIIPGMNVDFSGAFPDISLVEINVLTPRGPEFDNAEDWQNRQESASRQRDGQGILVYPEREIDFDDTRMIGDEGRPEMTRLTVQTRVLYPLKIPLVNWIIFQLWYAQEQLRATAVKSTFQEWVQQKGRLEGGSGGGRYMHEAVADSEGQGMFDDFWTTTQWTKEMRFLRDMATRHNIYLMPLFGSYAMQMQSNPFFTNRREPAFFDITD